MKHRYLRYTAFLLCMLFLCALLPIDTLAAITQKTDFFVSGDSSSTNSMTVRSSDKGFATATDKGLKYVKYTGSSDPVQIGYWISEQKDNHLTGWTDAAGLNWTTSNGDCWAELGNLEPGTTYMLCAYYGNPTVYSQIWHATTYSEAEETETTFSPQITDSCVRVNLTQSTVNSIDGLYYTRLAAVPDDWDSMTNEQKLNWRNAQKWERTKGLYLGNVNEYALLYPLEPGECVAYYSERLDHSAKTKYCSDVQFAYAQQRTRNRSKEVWSLGFEVEQNSRSFDDPADKLSVSYAPASEPMEHKLQVCADPTFAGGNVYTAVPMPDTGVIFYPGLVYTAVGWLLDEATNKPLPLPDGVYYYRIMILDVNDLVWYSNVRFFEIKDKHIQAQNDSVWSDPTGVGVQNGMMSAGVRGEVAFTVENESATTVSPVAGTTVDVATLYQMGFTASGTDVDVYPEAYTTVRIPVPEGADVTKLTPIYVDDEGVVHKLNTKFEIVEDSDGNYAQKEVPMTPKVVTVDGKKYMEFQTNHFSTYGLAQVTAKRVNSPTATVISNTEGSILAEGAFGSGYTLTSNPLSTKSAVYKRLALLRGNGRVLGAWEVKISPTWIGSVILHFNLGQKYANQNMTVLHRLDDGSVEYLYGTTDAGGRLSISTQSRSAFMVVQGHITDSPVNVPATGSALRLTDTLMLLCLFAALTAFVALQCRRRKDA